MRLLLDSHVVVWWLSDSRRLSAPARNAIRSPANEVFISAASVWELALKISLGKLVLPLTFMDKLRQDGFKELTVTADHALSATQLPPHHRDPFDRLLIAQALAENLTFVSQDGEIARYTVPLFS